MDDQTFNLAPTASLWSKSFLAAIAVMLGTVVMDDIKILSYNNKSSSTFHQKKKILYNFFFYESCTTSFTFISYGLERQKNIKKKNLWKWD